MDSDLSSAEISASLLPAMDVDSPAGSDSRNDASFASASASVPKKRGRPFTSSTSAAKPRPSQPSSRVSSSPRKVPRLDSSFAFKSTAPIPRPGFHAIPTFDASMPPQRLRIQMMEHEEKGIPLVIRGFHKLPAFKKALFTPEWLLKHAPTPDDPISVRNVYNKEDEQMPLNEFIKRCRNVTEVVPGETERYYGKDGQCPPEWSDWLSSSGVVPKSILPFSSEDAFSLVDGKDRAETLMTYIGVGGTFTPCHKDLCASVGQNLMVHTENEGSSVWYMSARDDATAVSQYFHSLGQEIDLETHVASEGELKTAPFKVYMHRQQLGDLICVPQNSCHQVINEGGITIKLSWSRMILSSLMLAYTSELPIYHRVCRPEVYSVKNLIHAAVTSYTGKLTETLERSGGEVTPRARSIRDRLKDFVSSYTEMIVYAWDIKRKGEPQTFDPAQQYRHSCDFCGADIFQSYFECRECDPVNHEPVILCSLCYVEGRSCECEYMEPKQIRPFKELLDVRNAAAKALNRCLDEADQINAAYSYEELEADELPHVHQAACILSEAVKTQKNDVAKCRDGGVHESPMAHTVTCSGCHKRMCFSHLIKANRTHPAAAILWSRNSKDYHNMHMSFKQTYLNTMEQMQTQKFGFDKLEGWTRLTYAILQYTKCRPYVNPRLVMGFFDEDYDNPSDVTTPALRKRVSQKSKKRPLESADTENMEAVILLPSTPVNGTPNKKRKLSRPSKGGASTERQPASSAAAIVKEEPSIAQLTPPSSAPLSQLQQPPPSVHGLAPPPSLAGPLMVPNPPAVVDPHIPQHAIPPQLPAQPPIVFAAPEWPAQAPPANADDGLLLNVVKEVSNELVEIRMQSTQTHNIIREDMQKLIMEHKTTLEARLKAQEEAHAKQLAQQDLLLRAAAQQSETLKNQIKQLEGQLHEAQARARRNEAIIDKLIGTGATGAIAANSPDRGDSSPVSATKATSNGPFKRRNGLLD